MKTRSCPGTVVECRSRDPEVPSSNPGVAKKKISHRSNQNNITTNHSSPDLNTWNCQRWKPKVTVAQCYSEGPEIQRSSVQTLVGQKENLSQVQSEQYHHQSLCTRVKYLKLSKVKTWSHCGTVLECSTRNPEVPISNPGVAKNKIPHRANHNNTTTNPSAPELITWNCQRWKPEFTVAQG